MGFGLLLIPDKRCCPVQRYSKVIGTELTSWQLLPRGGCVSRSMLWPRKSQASKPKPASHVVRIWGLSIDTPCSFGSDLSLGWLFQILLMLFRIKNASLPLESGEEMNSHITRLCLSPHVIPVLLGCSSVPRGLECP